MQDIRKSPEYQRWRREVRQRDEILAVYVAFSEISMYIT